MRRGLALEMGDVLCFDLHEVLRRRLLTAYTKVPQTGFLPVGLQQLLDADQLIWQFLGKKTSEGIKRRGTVERPLDKVMLEVLNSLEVQMALMTRQGVVHQPAAASSSSDLSSKLVAQLQKQIDSLKNES